MRNPVVELNHSRAWCCGLGTLGTRTRHLSYMLYQFSISVY
jgi:hypothetical protein